MRVLVTGISGFLGPYVAGAFQRRGWAVAGTYIGPRPVLAGVGLHEVDLQDLPGLAAIFHAVRPQLVVHLAGLSHVGESWRRVADYFAVNVMGTERVVDLAQREGGARVLFSSSAEVYGTVPEAELPIAESRLIAPPSPYAMSKAAGERWVLSRGGIVMRTFNVTGKGQAPIFALPAFAAQLAEIATGRAEPVLRVGNLAARRDFVHPEDAAEAFALVAERGGAGEVYNLASGTATSIAEALDRLIAVSGLEVRIEVDPERFRPVDVPALQGDARRLRELGWSPRHGLEQALADLWSAAREAALRQG
jgi:GDP-4-dehydro-6-deoxy-D-mannose reductase